MLSEKEGATYASYILVLLLPLALTPILLNIWASANYVRFGMTSSEVVKELWLVMLYFLTGGLAIIFAGRKKKQNKKIIFAIRIAVIICVFALSYNQITISRALAPIKAEFEKVAGKCTLKSGELKCGDALKQVLQKRDQALEKMHAVRVGDWRITAVNTHSITTDRDSAYFYFPF